VRTTENGCIAFAPATQSESEPISNNGFSIEFKLPGMIRFELPAMFKGAYMVFFTTPIGENTCRMDWLIGNWGFVKTDERVLWTGDGREIIGEDEFILTNVQQTYDTEGEDFEKSVEADIPTLTLRKIVKLAEKNEWQGVASQMPARRVFTMMTPKAFTT
jgi:hypothetical protein